MTIQIMLEVGLAIFGCALAATMVTKGLTGPKAFRLGLSGCAIVVFGLGLIMGQTRLWGQDTPVDQQAARDRVLVETLLRIKGIDVNSNPKYLEAVQRHLQRQGNDPSQLKIIEQLKLLNMGSRLLDLAAQWGQTTEAVQAIDLAIEQGNGAYLADLLTASEPTLAALTIAKTLGLSNRKDIPELLVKVLMSKQSAASIKMEVAVGLAGSTEGQRRLLDIAKSGTLPIEVRLIVGSSLRSAADESVRSAAADIFPAIKSNQMALPPITELVKRIGKKESGKTVFAGLASCSQCHTVRSEGKNVGPDLSEIGDKLSREAMYVSILDPSAGISHNYESYIAVLEDDSIITGLLVSQTDEGVILNDAKGIQRTIPRSAISELKKSPKSLMPENLQETMSVDGLVDLVEYLMTLRKK